MATIAHASSAIRIAGTNGRSVCNINGIDPDMTAADAAGFVEGIEELYNSGPVTARISTMSNLER